MYLTLLVLHSYLRWVVLLAGVVAVIVAIRGWSTRKSWSEQGRLPSSVFLVVLDLQILLGVILYAVSPVVRGAWRGVRSGMDVDQLRFFAFEHGGGMLLAVILARLGSELIGRGQSDVGKFRQAAIWYSLSILVMVLSTPWWRPLVRGL